MEIIKEDMQKLIINLEESRKDNIKIEQGNFIQAVEFQEKINELTKELNELKIVHENVKEVILKFYYIKNPILFKLGIKNY